MRVKDLLKNIKHYKKKYPDFLEWNIYTEQITPIDRKFKTTGKQKSWGKIKDSEDWEYFECAGYNTIFEKEKIFTINVNF